LAAESGVAVVIVGVQPGGKGLAAFGVAGEPGAGPVGAQWLARLPGAPPAGGGDREQERGCARLHTRKLAVCPCSWPWVRATS